MITEERKWQALMFLSETDSECAELEGDVARKEYMLDLIKDRVFLATTGNVEERKATARLSAETSRAHEEWIQALVKFKTMNAKRKTEALMVDTWRSENANRRQAG